MTAIEIRSFSIGDVLGRSLSVWNRNMAPVWICFLLLLPAQLMEHLAGRSLAPQGLNPSLTDLMTAIGVIVASSVFSLAASAAIAYGTLQQLANRRAGVGECLGRSLSLIFPLFGTSIVVGLAIILGLAALIVPGVILAVMWWLVIPVVVMERPGVFAALGRSAELTKGHRWSVFGVLILVLIIVFAFAFVMHLVMALSGSPTVPPYISFMIDSLGTVLFATASAVAYHDLRVEKEGADANQVAAVFD